MSATQLIELRRARHQRVERRAADLSPLSFCLPPSNLARHQPDPGREIVSRPKHRRIRRRRHDRGRPQNPMPGSVSTR
jgi:hypothetical protein